VVTVNGSPAFQLVPLKEDDDLIDRLVEHHPGFRRLLQRRLRERTVSAADAARRLAPRRRARPRSRA
jgi:antitoxin (DNA-binding transcriptional repressor) of toxin-antitoxin stability system